VPRRQRQRRLERHPLQRDGVDLLGGAQVVDGAEPLLGEVGEAAVQRPVHPLERVGPDRAVPPGPVTCHAHLEGQVEDHGDGRGAGGLRHPHERSPVAAPQARRVDGGHQMAALQAAADEQVEDGEGVRARRLVVRIVGDERPAAVGGHHLGLGEVASGEGRLAAAGDAHEQEQGGAGDEQRHGRHARDAARWSHPHA
jgi:hypothetical protein